MVLGFLIGSRIDENGVVTLKIFSIKDISETIDPKYIVTSEQVTKNTFKKSVQNEDFIGWIRDYDGKDTFRLRFITHFNDIMNRTLLQERNKILYCVDETEQHNIIEEFGICKCLRDKHRFHHFDNIESFEKLLACVSETYNDIDDYVMK